MAIVLHKPAIVYGIALSQRQIEVRLGNLIPSRYAVLTYLAHMKRTLYSEAKFSFQYSHALTPLSGIAVITAYIYSYYVEKTQAEMYFDTFGIRAFVAVSILVMMFRPYWLPKSSGAIYGIWLAFIATILPYCFGSITILNAAYSPIGEEVNLFTATEYVLSSFFLVQLVFHIPLILTVWIGANCIVFGQLLLVDQPNVSLVLSTCYFVAPFFGTVLLVGGIINKRLFNFQREKEQAVWNVANAIAHQLRTPLATIRNLSTGSKKHLPALVDAYAAALEHGLVREPVQPKKLEALGETLDAIIDEVRHSGALIDILIANSKPFEHLEAPKNEIQIGAIVRQAVDEFPYNNPHERQLVSVDTTHDFQVNALENMVLHVMFNLIGNAVEFSQKKPNGTVRIYLEPGDPWNKVIVRDTGIGIPKKYLHVVFDPFFSRNSQNGTGIGLSFCKSVMEGIGGKISCDSLEGEYCEFTLFFPHTTP